MKVTLLAEDPADPLARALAAHTQALRAHAIDAELVAAAAAPGAEPADLAVALGWSAAEALFRVPAQRRACAVARIEGFVADLPCSYLPLTRHAARVLAQLRPDAPLHPVRLGVEAAAPHEPAAGGPLRVRPLDRAGGEAIAAMREPHVGGDDVLVGLPHAAPLPSAVALVIADLPGADELVEHRVSGLLCEPGDPRGAARQLDLLARDRELLRALHAGARAAVQAWPTVERAAGDLAGALHAVAAEPVRDPAPAIAALLADVRGLERAHPAEPPADRPQAMDRLLALVRKVG